MVFAKMKSIWNSAPVMYPESKGRKRRSAELEEEYGNRKRNVDLGILINSLLAVNEGV